MSYRVHLPILVFLGACSTTQQQTLTASPEPTPATAPARATVPAPAVERPAAPATATVAAGAALQSTELQPGREVSATLARGGLERSGRPYQAWTLRATAGQIIQIDMRSAAFDAYMVLQDSAGRFVSADDNGGGGTNARIVHQVTAPGLYRVLARSFGESLGAYTIRLGEPSAGTEGIVGQARRGAEFTGTLGASDPRERDRPYQVWLIDIAAGDSLTIDLRSDAFDTILRIQDSRGRNLAENDDVDGELHSRIAMRFTEAGTYRLVATAFSADGAGAYTLRVR